LDLLKADLSSLRYHNSDPVLPAAPLTAGGANKFNGEGEE
jgi:hypothetical protein